MRLRPGQTVKLTRLVSPTMAELGAWLEWLDLTDYKTYRNDEKEWCEWLHHASTVPF